MRGARTCRFTVGDWSVDPVSGRIDRRGDQRALRPKEMALLVYLATLEGEIAGCDDLVEHVWDGLAVGDDAIYFSISQLRKVLGDSRENPRYIETISRRGYRLIAEVRRDGGGNDGIEFLAHGGRHPWARIWVLVLSTLVLLAIVLIAIVASDLRGHGLTKASPAPPAAGAPLFS